MKFFLSETRVDGSLAAHIYYQSIKSKTEPKPSLLMKCYDIDIRLHSLWEKHPGGDQPDWADDALSSLPLRGHHSGARAGTGRPDGGTRCPSRRRRRE
jgi:hypothetical protein